ncbi:MAG TPA: S8 family serine peptidase, partial [Pyrinomonadaceae bacterium]|nr:S8 family serine peptidase [Pyrinomonadaceae bacterium]
MADTNRILVKLRPSFGLAAAEARANLRPLHDEDPAAPGLGVAATSAAPAWYLADLPDGAATPWDLAHTQVAGQLGIDESAVVYAEPDLEHTIYADPNESAAPGGAFAALPNCDAEANRDQDPGGGRATGPAKFAWHLARNYSQLGPARDAVTFKDPRTRIGHIDTGYDPRHAGRPERILTELERNFVDGDNNPNSSADPNRDRVYDNSGHGTGTVGILAGRKLSQFGDVYLGGAPQADILPLRVANQVVLFRTSAFAQALRYATSRRCDVISISMGGLPSGAWNEAVNEAYDAGVCIVAAAGNNVSGLPTRHVVYPARYRRVIAVCGVMANGEPYDDLSGMVLEGNYGPDSSMTAAIASFTPNIPWPVFGCETAVRRNGEGTSAATPQVAAAAALWYENYKNVLPRDWHRVEAVRHALFSSAKAGDARRLGNGSLRAQAALAVKPVLNLPKTPADKDSFSFFRVITGLGVAESPPREVMFDLELTQRWMLNPELSEAVPDPEAVDELPRAQLRSFMDAVIADEGASLALRRHVAARYPLVFGSKSPPKRAPAEVVPPPRAACSTKVTVSDPPFRRLRAYAVDPSFSTRLDTAAINEVALKVRWEPLEPGPRGEYLEVVDTDAADTTYEPVDLSDPRLIAQDGCAPSEGNPQFHQQMVYAVAMTTISNFERALGRPVLWRPRINPDDETDDGQYVPRLLVRPHALRQANAFYSPQEVALLFGYFQASASDPGDHAPGSLVYACLSHDIIAHETTHAILDGMHRRFNEPTNPDMLALHEAFADIVALMQHFTIPDILTNEINRTRGDLEAESVLGSLAVQFGRATGGRGALRDAIGRFDERGVWTRIKPDPAEYRDRQQAPHTRGALLVAAVFDAFLAIYRTRTADLLRLYTGGTGVLPAGAIHPDLVGRLSDEAVKSAHHVLNMCIRALDYIPPVDVTFGEYLRGIITADFDLVADDRYNYRVAFVEAFRRRGIYPRDLDTLSVETLRWDAPDLADWPRKGRDKILEQLKRYADLCFYIGDREKLFRVTRDQREALHGTLEKAFEESPDFAAKLGLDPKRTFEVHELRRSIRVSPDGKHIPQIIGALTQSARVRGGDRTV